MSDTTDQNQKSRWTEYLNQIPFLGEYINPKERVAVLRMAGVIADTSVMRRAGINYHKFQEAVEEAFDVPRLKAVVLVINSPGGAPAQCSLISVQIRSLSEEKNIPVYAFIEDVAASGGYWLACIADEIYAQNSSIVGSIGVISSGFGLDQFIQKHDITRRVHTSGRDKSFMDPFKAEKFDDVERLKKLQAGIHQSFKDWVYERRGSRLKGDERELMEGSFWTGTDALDLGLIDGIGDVSSVLKEKFGSDIKIKNCTPEKKSILSSILPLGGDAKIDIGSLVDVAEEKTFWGRFGL